MVIVNKIKFSNAAESYPIDVRYRVKFVQAFEYLYDGVRIGFKNTFRYKSSIIDKINYLIYSLYTDNCIPYDWKQIVRDENFTLDIDDLNDVVKLRCSVSMIIWDIEALRANNAVSNLPSSTASSDSNLKVQQPKPVNVTESISGYDITPKEDLFIVYPKYPRVLDIHPRYSNIHRSFPEIPTKQCEVSCTTDVLLMNDKALMNLYPKQFIRTRSSIMYEPREGMTLDPNYGLLVPVDGFSDSEVRDCIIRYPHIFKLKRFNEEGDIVSFYSHIEIDKELVDVYEAWKFLPESKIFDLHNIDSVEDRYEFMKEYAIRRYLLERDIKGIDHKYPVIGDLPEFITLFMPYSMYQREGYEDPVQLARLCVCARIKYLRSRNPRIGKDVSVQSCPFDAFCTQSICDQACVRWAQMDYLMMRNELTLSSSSFSMSSSNLEKYDKIYQSCLDKTSVLQSSNTVTCSEYLKYIMVCNCWPKSAIKVRCYSLSFSNYVQQLQHSWSSNKSDDFEYTEIWSRSSQVLIISGLDYVNFKDFQSQVLLQLIQDREQEHKTTIIISPQLDKLVGNGAMFNLMLNKLRPISKTVN